MKRFLKIKERLGKRFGEQVFLDAQRDLLNDTLDKPRRTSSAAKWFSLAVLSTPFMAIAPGLVIVLTTFPNLIALLFGGAIAAVGVVLLPWPRKIKDTLHRRTDMPASFALLDALADEMQTERLTGVQVLPDYNAFMLHQRGERVLGIGAILWRSATPEERLAILAHELAHQVNGDPARTGFTSKALATLQGWLWYLEPEGDTLLDELLMYIPFSIVSGVYRGLLGLTYLESQRAEYLADAIASRVSGTAPMISTLQRFAFSEQIEIELNAMHGARAPEGIEMIDRLANSTLSLSPKKRAELLEQVATKKLSVDATHPPSTYRIAFLELLESNEGPEPIDFGALLAEMDAELVPYFASEGDDLKRQLMIADGH